MNLSALVGNRNKNSIKIFLSNTKKKCKESFIMLFNICFLHKHFSIGPQQIFECCHVLFLLFLLTEFEL